MRQPIVKDLRSKTKDFRKCPRGASRPRPWPRGLHHCYPRLCIDYVDSMARYKCNDIYIYIYLHCTPFVSRAPLYFSVDMMSVVSTVVGCTRRTHELPPDVGGRVNNNREC